MIDRERTKQPSTDPWCHDRELSARARWRSTAQWTTTRRARLPDGKLGTIDNLTIREAPRQREHTIAIPELCDNCTVRTRYSVRELLRVWRTIQAVGAA